MTDTLFQQICDESENDEVRLRYANQIEDADPAHARFIRIQVQKAAARRTGGEWWPGGEDEELLQRHRSRWAQYIGKYVPHGDLDHVYFDRGFPVGITIQPELFAEYGEFLFRLAPLRHVTFCSSLDDDWNPIVDEDGNLARFPMEDLLRCPQLTRLDSIAFRGVRFKAGHPDGPGDIGMLARCPYLTRCLHLNLYQTEAISEYDHLELAEGALTSRMLVVMPQWLGERTVAGYDGQGDYEDTVFDERWREVERRLGYVPWMHPSQNEVSPFDARWAVDTGKLPKYPPGSPPKPEWYEVPRRYKPRRLW